MRVLQFVAASSDIFTTVYFPLGNKLGVHSNKCNGPHDDQCKEIANNVKCKNKYVGPIEIQARLTSPA